MTENPCVGEEEPRRSGVFFVIDISDQSGLLHYPEPALCSRCGGTRHLGNGVDSRLFCAFLRCCCDEGSEILFVGTVDESSDVLLDYHVQKLIYGSFSGEEVRPKTVEHNGKGVVSRDVLGIKLTDAQT